jgi:hypothetical protein
MSEIEKIIELLLIAAQRRNEHLPGELDRKREQQVINWKRLHSAGVLDDEALQELIKRFDSGLDYQRDHPLNEIDETLDSAMTLALNLKKDAIQTIAGVLDDSVRKRLSTYSVRCASRSLFQKSEHFCNLGVIACLLALHKESIDSRDLMVSLAPLHVAAQGTEFGAGVLFERHIEFAHNQIQEIVVVFSKRKNVALREFGWTITESKPIQWIVWAE